MPAPQPLPKDLPTDIVQLKTLLETALTGRGVSSAVVKQEKENVDEYDRQIKQLGDAALKNLKLDRDLPKLPNP